MNDNPVVTHGDAWVGHDFSVVVIFTGRVVDVVRLPGQWRKAHVEVGGFHRVEATTFVVLAFQSKRVEHLAFITSLQIDTTVTASLTAVLRLVR